MLIKKKMFQDFVVNIMATVIPIAVLQLLVFPQLARITGVEAYGRIITVVSLMTLISDSYGNVLNNIRLLQDGKYTVKGDFNRILFSGSICNIFAVLAGLYFFEINSSSIIGVIVASTLILLRAYYIVAFRLKLNFKGILINNIILTVGYCIGFWLFVKTNEWVYIYICANGLSLVQLFWESDLIKEPFSKTNLFHETLRKFGILYIAFVLKTFINYADKILIFPILGAEAVAYYYAASIMGKIMSMGITPVSSVLLSYVVKEDSLSRETFKKVLLLLLALSVIGFWGANWFGKFLLKILYEPWYEITVSILPWTVFSAVEGCVSSVLQPFVLRFKSEIYQIIVNSIFVVIYVVLSIILVEFHGLIGFCVGYSITMLIKVSIDLMLVNTIAKD